MSEAELHVLKTRMLEGRRAKAQRGELFFNLPRGYVRSRAGEIVFDSDEQVQATIRLVFDTFERRRTINGVLAHLVAHDIQLPRRVRTGAAKGDLEWHAPNRYTLSEMLQSPLYAGAYAYGRRSVDPRRPKPGRPGTGQKAGSPAVLIKNRWPAYISWEAYERNLEQVAANRSAERSIPRGGPALLAGLIVCGRCGQRMAAQYPNGGRFQRYCCSRLAMNYGAPLCQSLSGRALDALVGERMLQALAPAALEVSLHLVEDLELERTALHRQWGQRLERARYEVERAQRQYDAVEPENRLVVRTLEQRWEAALADEVRLKAEHERFLAGLAADERRTRCDRAACVGHPDALDGSHHHGGRPPGNRTLDAGPCRRCRAGQERARSRRVSLGRRHADAARPAAAGGPPDATERSCRPAAAHPRAAQRRPQGPGDLRGAERRGLDAAQAPGNLQRSDGAQPAASPGHADCPPLILDSPAARA